MAKKKPDPKPRAKDDAPDMGAPTTCYLCGQPILPDQQVARAHELVMHRTCYEADLRKGKSPS
jgi:hypothetical protein